MTPPKPPAPKNFCSTTITRLFLSNRAAKRVVHKSVMTTNRFIDWILFEQASQTYKNSSPFLAAEREPRAEDQSMRSTLADFTSDIVTTTNKYRMRISDAQGRW